MEDNLLGGVLELSLRYLLLLDNEENKYITEDRICALDYMITYAADFNMSDFNLHGNNEYRSGEYWSRQSLAKDALKSLVRLGLINVRIVNADFEYCISETGSDTCRKMECDYANEYLAMAAYISYETSDQSDKEIQHIVTTVLSKTNSGGTNNG